MAKNNSISGVLVLVVILAIAVSTFLAVSYASGVMTSAMAFASTTQMVRLQTCGIYLPTELLKLQTDIPGIILPSIYVGFPGLMIFIAILMFIAGYYYGNEKDVSSSETTTTTRRPGWDANSGKYESGTRLEETRTQKTSRSESK